MANDYYSILGVPSDANPQEIKRAFRQIARECHPDVSGGDPAAGERFKAARKAYETLMDPVTRARYDRRGQRRTFAGGSFFDAFYKKTATGAGPSGPARDFGAHDAGGHYSGHQARNDPGNTVSLDDLVDDFGDFGFGVVGMRSRTKGPTGQQTSYEAPPRLQPMPGEDVHIELDIPERVAREGGSVTAVYYRMQRADSWRPGSADPGIVRIQDIADVRVVPGTRDGEVFRERGRGNAGPHGGPYGDLVVRVRVVREPRPTPGRRARTERREPPPQPPPRAADTAPAPEPPPAAEAPEPPPAAEAPSPPPAEPAPVEPPTLQVDVPVVVAMLGGPVELDTPGGRVRITIRPGTSGGTRLRLRNRGELGDDGKRGDVFVLTRVVVPEELDEESTRLIQEFAERNA